MRPLIQLVLRHPRTVIVLWLLVLVAAAPFALKLGAALRGSTDAVTGSPPELVSRDLNAAFGEGSAFVFPAVLTSAATPAGDPAFAAAAATMEGALRDSAGVRDVRHYWNTGDSALLGSDGRRASSVSASRSRSRWTRH